MWFTTTAWMMWNALVSSLLTGASAVLLDGNPAHPDLGMQFRLAGETRATLMGASSAFVMGARAAGIVPRKKGDLSALRQIVAAGSPLPADGYHWLDEQLGPDVLINVGSGGTDVCSGIVQGSPLQPVWIGEIAGPCLAVAAQAFDEDGRPVVDELGELVITQPMPSMPVAFWGDLPVTEEGSRYRDTYFSTYPGVWRHGDWVRFAATGSCVVAGRSDATLNRGGVRLGTAEFYGVVEELPYIEDSLVLHLEDAGGGMGELLLFVALRDGPGFEGTVLDDALRAEIAGALRGALSPRHVPDKIVAVPAIPRNRTGKKLELPAKRLLQGRRFADVASREVLADPTSLDVFVDLAARRAGS
jgi:acetoacetyl-CoA synthetase